MLQGLRSLSATLFIMLCISLLFTGNNVNAEDQVLPWPWDTACPFPWDGIEGAWTVESPLSPEVSQDIFEFKVTYVAEDGSRYFNINRYDSHGTRIGRGSGQAPDYMKIIRAAMIETDESGKSLDRAYWIYVRAYQENAVKDCSADLTTVMTIRPFSDIRRDEVHLVLSKIEGNSPTRDSKILKD